ncbi:MAG: acyltransferase [Deltaproteobacteria bacterium]|nr:acyltransferase [Deltaproteobacteria bacterium]
MRYRSDLDGLRCVAVLAVVLFHAPIAGFAGGFVGVDIFFVISGYLISRLVWTEVEQGSFSLARFYERRARRILPAVSVTILLTSLPALWLLFPRELHAFGQSVVTSALFASNLYFLDAADYFGGKDGSSLLLHLWSLGVEEQFYLAFPLLFVCIKKYFRGRYVTTVVGLAFASFALNLVATVYAPRIAFYSMPTRAWEFLLGTLVAIGALPEVRSVLWREALAVFGLLLIFLAIFSFDPGTAFPGYAALVPCLGAACLLHAGERDLTGVSRLLSVKPLVSVGLISYSVYLWHWPLDVYYALGVQTFPSRLAKVGLVAAAIGCGALSWWIVEQPFRTRQLASSPRALVRASCLAALALLAVGGALVLTRGLPTRFSAKATQYASFLGYPTVPVYRDGVCFLTPKYNRIEDFRTDICLKPVAGARNILLLGDSHAAQYWKGLSNAYRDVRLLQGTGAGCKPLLGGASGEKPCPELMRPLLGEFLAQHRLEAVVLAARWRPADLGPLLATVKHVKKLAPRVIVIGPIVEYRIALPRLVALAEAHGRPEVVEAARVRELKQLDGIFARELAAAQVEYVSAYRTLCGPTGCVTTVPSGAPVQFDYGHLTEEGATFMAQEWRKGRIWTGL